MADGFDSGVLAKLGWRQGAILNRGLAERAWRHAPERVRKNPGDWLILTSHDCDVLNHSLAREPVVEVLRARVTTDTGGPAKLRSSGRNPRALVIPEVIVRGNVVALDLEVHDRWSIPRELLMEEKPVGFLARKDGRLVAEWLAKRYIRAAFPTTFDLRWRRKSKAWRKLLTTHSAWIQGVYLRLDTQEELPDDRAYRCELILAVPRERQRRADWPDVRDKLERAFEKFWGQFSPDIHLEAVDARRQSR